MGWWRPPGRIPHGGGGRLWSATFRGTRWVWRRAKFPQPYGVGPFVTTSASSSSSTTTVGAVGGGNGSPRGSGSALQQLASSMLLLLLLLLPLPLRFLLQPLPLVL